MMMSVEQSVEWELAGETEVRGEKLPQCHSVHHKSHMIWPVFEPGAPRWEACIRSVATSVLTKESWTAADPADCGLGGS
jgi:hypothetical protein